jgi:hypothetical protein
MGTLDAYVELLTALVSNAATDTARRRWLGKIAAAERDFTRLRSRRERLMRQRDGPGEEGGV